MQRTILAAVFVSLPLITFSAEWRTLESGRLHLRSGTNAEWQEFAAAKPFSNRVGISFEAQRNTNEQTLVWWQDDVRHDWRVELNGRRIGKLHEMEAPLEFALPLPANTLRKGSNYLALIPPRENDDIRFGSVRLSSQPLRQALGDSSVEVEIVDEANNALPCKLTFADSTDSLAMLSAETNALRGIRPGVIYTADGKASARMPVGTYRITATRGFEFSRAQTNVTLAVGQSQRIRLQLQREVNTRGLVSCDTHIHTFTHSKHGDATIHERTVTLAGEGIELPIVTDHDVAVDLAPAAVATRTRQFFTPVIGDEVTTRVGHFNIFPIAPGAALPSNQETNWTKLIDAFRRTPGVQIIVFNHPRNTHSGFQPFAATNFNALTAEPLWPFDFRVDAMELVNSSAQQSDWTTVLRDWFALWNAGHFITAVGSSDGHDVTRYIVGQGRTYIACDDTRADALNVSTAFTNLKQGRAYVSMGLLPIVTVNEQFTVGDLEKSSGKTLKVHVQVRAPSWISCHRVELFANGVLVAETNVTSTGTTIGVAAEANWEIPRPRHDVALVVVATGPGTTAPHWPIPKPYQPSSPIWEGRVIGVANPVRIDGDGDGQFTSARTYAERIIAASSSPEQWANELESLDESIGIQLVALAQKQGAALERLTTGFRASPKAQAALSKVMQSRR